MEHRSFNRRSPQARREPARAPGQTTFRAPPHPRVRYSTNWTTAPTQGYNLEENPLKIILFLCFRQILVRSATFDSHPAARGRSWIPLGNWRHVKSDEQFLTSTFLPARFHLFSYQLNFLRGPLGPPGPGALASATPPSRWAYLPLLFGPSFSIVNCYLHYVDILLITWMDGWMDGRFQGHNSSSVYRCVGGEDVGVPLCAPQAATTGRGRRRRRRRRAR